MKIEDYNFSTCTRKAPYLNCSLGSKLFFVCIYFIEIRSRTLNIFEKSVKPFSKRTTTELSARDFVGAWDAVPRVTIDNDITH